MRTTPFLLLALFLVAGCTGQKAPGGIAATDTATGGLYGAVGAGNQTAAKSSYDLTRNLEYNHSLARFALVADGNASVVLTAASSTSMTAFHDGCSALAAYTDVAGDKSGLVLLAWTRNANVYAEATVAGQRIPIVPNQFPEDSTPTGSIHLDGSAQVDLRPGERFIVELGGDSQAAPAPEFVANLTVTGSAHLERLPSAPMACGTGTRDAQGSAAGLNTYLVTSSVGGALAFDSHRATTLVALYFDPSGENAARLKFLDTPETPLPAEVALSSAKAGSSAITLDHWTDSAGELVWFFADTYWPIYSSAK